MEVGADPVVVVEDLRREFRMGSQVVAALDGVTFTIRRGEYWAVMGSSGSGKSTLLYVLGCLDRHTGGRYVLAGRDTSRLDDDALSEIRGRSIGFVFQSFHLIPQLNVLENIETPLLYHPEPPESARDRAIALAQRVGLGDRLRHRPSELSGGQMQRVAIARALLNDPEVLLADEATGNLDSHTAAEILHLFDELHEEGKTIIHVTHDASVGRRAGKILRLSDGKVTSLDDARVEATA